MSGAQRTRTLTSTALLAALSIAASACGGLASTESQGAGQAEVEVRVVDPGEGAATVSTTGESADAGGDEQADVDTSEVADDGGGEQTETTNPTTAAPGDGGLRVAAPTCEPGPRSLFDPGVNADVETITTNQIVEGSIEEFSVDVWKIDLCADQVVFFDALGPCSGEDGDWLRWDLVIPDGGEAIDLGDMVNSVGSCDGDIGPIRIPESGEYSVYLHYDGVADQEATYRFEVRNVAPPEEFTIAVGDRIDVNLGEGAGRIEHPGARDRYLIDLTEGDRIFFDVGDDCDGADGDWLRANLILPDGDEAIDLGDFINSVGSCQDPDPVTIPETGQYVLDIGYGDDSDSTARIYSVDVRDAG